MTNKWDKRFMEVAELVASWSKDPTTKVGAVIVSDDKNIASVGYNGFNSYTLEEGTLYDQLTRQEKRDRTIHAELNAIFNAAKNGAKVKGMSLYVTYPCCSNCSLAIIQSGIKEVIYPGYKWLNSDWVESNKRSVSLFKEANIIYRSIGK